MLWNYHLYIDILMTLYRNLVPIKQELSILPSPPPPHARPWQAASSLYSVYMDLHIQLDIDTVGDLSCMITFT